jgi:hypothetical protein
MRWMVIYEYRVPGGALNLNSTNYPDHGLGTLECTCLPSKYIPAKFKTVLLDVLVCPINTYRVNKHKFIQVSPHVAFTFQQQPVVNDSLDVAIELATYLMPQF